MSEGNLSLDEYYPQIKKIHKYGLRMAKKHYYNFFPVGPTFIAAPFVIAFESAPRFWISVLPGFERFRPLVSKSPSFIPTAIDVKLPLERCVASFVVAAAGVLIFLIGVEYLSVWWAFLLSAVFIFCTPAWSTASRGLWGHGPTMLCFSFALYLFVRARRQPELVQYASIPLVYSYLMRPTSSVSVAFFALYVLASHRNYFFRFAGWGSLAMLPFLIGNIGIYGRLLPSYYRPGRIVYHPEFFTAFWGNLLSPSRGLFIFSPVLLFAFVGLAVLIRDRKIDFFTISILGAAFFQAIVVALFPTWWGGHCYGQRYLADIVPYLMYFMIFFFAWLNGASRQWKWAGGGAFVLLASLSFAIHYLGANSPAVYGWNVSPNNIDAHTERVWDWTDPQFLRGVFPSPQAHPAEEVDFSGHAQGSDAINP